jgi:thiamine-phosphate pyrophosphorylase
MDRTLANTAAKLKRMRGSRLPAIWWMSDEARGRPHTAVAGLPRGSAVILRHYAAPHRAVLARELAVICERRGLTLLIAGDWRLAAAIDAAGCHLPEYAARRGPEPGLRLWCRHKKRLLSAAAHSRRALARAHAIGADAALLSPIFAKAGQRPLGVTRAALLAFAARLPTLALGGVGAKTARALRGVAGIAGIGFAL